MSLSSSSEDEQNISSVPEVVVVSSEHSPDMDHYKKKKVLDMRRRFTSEVETCSL